MKQLVFMRPKLPIPSDVPRSIYLGEPFPDALKRFWDAEEAACLEIEKENPDVSVVREPYMPLLICRPFPVSSINVAVNIPPST